MEKTYYSNGKLLITGEYTVLDGATALALPTKTGQDLVIQQGQDKTIIWKSYDSDGSIWFEDTIPFSAICGKEYMEKNDNIRNTLIEILHEAWLLNPSYIDNSEGYAITTHLTFPKSWGLGTSSTLINNIAQWLSINAFTLLKNSFGGSGYDIACAQNDTPILYRLENGDPIVTAIAFNPEFRDHLYFVYLNKKQSSKAAIASYYHRQNNITKVIPQINKITNATLTASHLKDFAWQLEQHEIIMSDVLQMQTVKESLFNDFKGVVKSLGGWGGDFVLAVSKENPTEYFTAKGYKTVVPYEEMIL